MMVLPLMTAWGDRTGLRSAPQTALVPCSAGAARRNLGASLGHPYMCVRAHMLQGRRKNGQDLGGSCPWPPCVASATAGPLVQGWPSATCPRSSCTPAWICARIRKCVCPSGQPACICSRDPPRPPGADQPGATLRFAICDDLAVCNARSRSQRMNVCTSQTPPAC
jgi:hypothetical protein